MLELTTEIDPRLQNLSYSTLLTLHSCPRKMQLYKLQSKIQEGEGNDNQQDLTFAFGHLVGDGIQMALQGASEEEIIWKQFLAWPIELYEENEKQNKSFWLAINAIRKFIGMRKGGFLDDYELVYLDNGKPAVELGFRITFPNGFKFRGYVDAVLRHKLTGAIVVLEIKTTSDNILVDAKFKNSAQAIGYSIVLDSIFPGLSDYSVIYLPYKTKEREYQVMEFSKTLSQRAQWIQELLLDIDTIILYQNTGVYPQRGESCYAFFRECEYFNICQLSTERLTIPLDQKTLDKLNAEEYDYELTLLDLLEQQLQHTD